jgi:aryl-alcohol dehydrogenase-like predicted oxidoreductase
MMFGGQTNENDSMSIMDYAFDHGVNIFDTANTYNVGESERIVGKWLKRRRDKIILATKVGAQMGDGINNVGLSRRYIHEQIDISLKRIGVDYIDIYYMHTPDYLTNIEETLETMSELVRAGKIHYIGVSNYRAWQVADIIAVCKENNFVPPVITQNVYNLITRGIDDELVPFLKAHNIGMTIYNPIAGGLLTGKHKPNIPAENSRFSMNTMYSLMYYNRYWTDDNFEAVEKLKKIAEEVGLNLLELSYKWCARRDCVTSILCGVSKLSQIENNVEILDDEHLLDDEVMKRCDEVWHSLPNNRFKYYH